MQSTWLDSLAQMSPEAKCRKRPVMMPHSVKIIVSHDIDHWRWRDHAMRDLYVPKYLGRTLHAMARRRISTRVFTKKLLAISSSRQHRLDELIAFNRSHGIEATFFVAVAPGRSLSYAPHATPEIVTQLRHLGCSHIGLHGIIHHDAEAICRERASLALLLGHEDFGVRMHYLRHSEETLGLLAEAGFPFSSNLYGAAEPTRIGTMIEIPIGTMDVRAVRDDGVDVRQAVAATLEDVERARCARIPYFVIDFHDHYFDEAWPAHHDWYCGVISSTSQLGYSFATFREAVDATPGRSH